ncbi:hypothetical protein F4815DRAFT_448792 [Daldinia loculata]|nr:hypothetical protein F4815DRAFT_448792 [Daldinia loculata]
MNREQRKRDSNVKEPGTCDPGFVFYSCRAGFVGCCAVEACNPGGCPDDALPSNTEGGEDITSTTSPPGGETKTQTQTVTLDITSTSTITSSSSPEPSTTSSDSATGAITPPPLPPLLPPSSPPTSSSSPSLNVQTPPTSALPQANTTSPTPPLSTAAIAGICVSSTIFALTALLIAGLLIRRRRIAKRVAAETLPNSPYADEPERFMMDHPAWRGQGQGVFRGVSELP